MNRRGFVFSGLLAAASSVAAISKEEAAHGKASKIADKDTLKAIESLYMAGAITPNEIRRLLKLPAV